jgi:hypothetical protein
MHAPRSFAAAQDDIPGACHPEAHAEGSACSPRDPSLPLRMTSMPSDPSLSLRMTREYGPVAYRRSRL